MFLHIHCLLGLLSFIAFGSCALSLNGVKGAAFGFARELHIYRKVALLLLPMAFYLVRSTTASALLSISPCCATIRLIGERKSCAGPHSCGDVWA